MTDFKSTYGPWVLVAGASEGLGAAFAEALAERGLNLILIARRQDKLESLSKQLKASYSVETSIHSVDLANYKTVKQLVLQFEQPIGLLVYNAAYAPIGYFKNISEDQLAQLVAVNITTPLLLTNLLTEPMLKNKKGGVVLMSSLAGTQGSPKIASYAASKAFNSIFSEGLWHELRPHNIHVIASCAGAISTPGYQQAKNAKQAPGTLSPKVVAEQTLKSLGNTPTIIPGFTNKLAHFFMNRLIPRTWAISIMHKNTKHLS